MQSSVKRYEGDFYDADYYERGKESGKGWLENYRWMPQRNFREAFAYIDCLKLDENSRVLDLGCAKGFIVRALRELGLKADGCDISQYALGFAPEGCWECSNDNSWLEQGKYTHVISKDVFEHLTKEQVPDVLSNVSKLSDTLMCVIPMGDNGKYRIPEYHTEISHLIAEDEEWWEEKFKSCGWDLVYSTNHIKGLKDNWCYCSNGNRVFVLKKKELNEQA